VFRKKDIKAFSDEELIEKYKGDKNNLYLGELFERYIRFVFLISMKYLKDEDLSKDMSMQVFEKLSNDLLRFEIKNFKSWLHTVTRNQCFMHLRAYKQIVSLPLEGKNDPLKNMETGYELHPNDIDSHEVKLEQLEGAIKTLDDNQKQCIELFYLQEKSYKEVTEITGFSMNEVKSHIQNGKRNLKNYLILKGEFLLLVFSVLYLNM
jgi:RNA polymerase sigma-70 factor (ECF subfamily)